MRVYPVMPMSYNTGANNIRKTNFPDNTVNVNSGVILTFTGADKNINQFVSYAPENKRFGLGIYNAGGLGVVSQEAPQNWRVKEGADVRDFAPYHSIGTGDGGIRVVKLKKGKDGKYLTAYPASSFYTIKQSETLDDLRKRVKLGKGEELSYVIQGEPNGKGLHKIIRLQDSGISGSIERPSTASIFSPETVKYRLFTAVDFADKGERNAVYFIHTEDLARFERAYGATSSKGNKGYIAHGADPKEVVNSGRQAYFVSANVSYADSNRALVDLMPKLNTPEHGNFNPANWWLHDRPAFMVMNAIADRSHAKETYYDGLRVHGTFHNPGRDYQGATDNPFEFFRMVATKEDIAKLNKHPQISELHRIEVNWNSASADEKRFVRQIMDGFLGKFKDELGTYNITMVPVRGTEVNPQNMTSGTVSINYGQEMRSSKTPEIAQGLTGKFAQIHTIDITNGSTPANLRLNDATADFCRSGHINGLTRAKAGFTPYEYRPILNEAGEVVSDNIADVIKAKKANTKWLIDTLAGAFRRGGENALALSFFSKEQLNEGASVYGHLSPYREGDILLMGWGRPDPQKGFPSTFQAFLDFLRDPKVPQSAKMHTKLLVGAGVWNEGARDYGLVKDIIDEINKLDGGRYKGQACYVNGFFPNRLVGCATYSILTSRFEPCGITPLESFAAGTPVISTKTGGAPDFISAARGYLTQNPYLRSVDDLRRTIPNIDELLKKGKSLGEILDTQRMLANAEEVKECIAKAASDYAESAESGKLSKYVEMVRDAITQKIDWHENSAYNLGKTANERYMTEVFEIQKGMQARNTKSLSRLAGEHFNIADPLKELTEIAKRVLRRIRR